MSNFAKARSLKRMSRQQNKLESDGNEAKYHSQRKLQKLDIKAMSKMVVPTNENAKHTKQYQSA